MDKLVEKIIEYAERYWRHHRTRILLPAAVGLLLIGHLTGYGVEPLEFRDLALAALLGVSLYYFWIWENKCPTIPKGTVGVVLALTCENDAHDKQVRADMVATLRQLLHSDQATTRFHLLDLPRHHAQRCVDGESANRVISEARGHFLLYGSVRVRSVDGAPTHLLSLEGLVRHTNQSPEVRGAIVADFRAVLPRRVQFSLDNDAFAFEATSEWAELAARYVIGLAAMASGDVWYAERLLLSVEKRLRTSAARIAPLQNIAQRLPERFVQLYSQWIVALHNAYFLSHRREFVDAADVVATKLLARDPSHYTGLMQSAIGHFVIRRDIAAAKKAIMGCRRVRDVAWRYSLGFLLAYEGNMRRAREEYHEAFQGQILDVTLPLQCEEFIHLVLAEEPDKVQLLFCSGLINEFAKEDLEGACRDYRAFLGALLPGQFADEAQIAERKLRQLCSEGERLLVDGHID